MSYINIFSFLLAIFILWRISIGPECGGFTAGPCYLESFVCDPRCKKNRYICYYDQRNYRKCTWY